MKTLLTLLLFVFTCSLVLAQENTPTPADRLQILERNQPVTSNPPLFIVQLNQKRFETRSTENATAESILKEIDPDWIESIEVFKDEKAKEKFGDKGHAGVVLIALKKESAEKMSRALSKRFE